MSNLEELRMLTEWTGVVSEPQVLTLKRCTMLITNSSKVVLGLDTNEKTLTYSSDADEVPAESKMMQEMVGMVLGRGWKAVRGIVETDVPDTRPARKSRRTAKRKGTRSSAKARKRSK